MNNDTALYVVSTPIGNLDDMTLRGIETLKNVDFILCEDTRRSIKLLNRYDIKKQLVSYHKFNEYDITDKIIGRLISGEKAALISDAGTPLISDPGNLLIRKVIECAIPYTVIPGANAVLPALILSGFDVDNFLFIGFLPKKKTERDSILQTVAQSGYPCVLYASPHELKALLKSISDRMPQRALSISKELTKIHEKTVRGTAAELYESCEEENKGEFTLVISACKDQVSDARTYSDDELREQYMTMLRGCKTPGAALKEVAKMTGIPKNELYAKLKIKDS
jgi:16S rRNA (cytidine1402-2'-O)-methyltransferase